MASDTTKRGLERLICTALTGHPCDPLTAGTVAEPSAGYGGVSATLPSLKQAFQRAPLRRMLLGVALLELLQVDQLPANCRQARGFRQAHKTEVGLGIVKGEQESRDIAF